MVYDEMFTTVKGALTDAIFGEDSWQRLITLGGYERTVDDADMIHKVPSIVRYLE